MESEDTSTTAADVDMQRSPEGHTTLTLILTQLACT